MGSHRSRMIEKSHVRPTCFVLLSVQGKQLCPCKLNLYMLYLLCFVMFVHISCFFFSLLSLFGGNKEIIIITYFAFLFVYIYIVHVLRRQSHSKVGCSFVLATSLFLAEQTLFNSKTQNSGQT